MPAAAADVYAAEPGRALKRREAHPGGDAQRLVRRQAGPVRFRLRLPVVPDRANPGKRLDVRAPAGPEVQREEQAERAAKTPPAILHPTAVPPGAAM